MEMEQPRLVAAAATTFDEASLERSKGFVKALQELKNLRPQLYSAAEYCEKSYLHSEQKQMVLDNLKDYAVRALVNAVDHVGTVAYKLTDILEQQTSDVDSMVLKITCLSQQLFTCQTYMDKEGLRQQQLVAIIPRHYKRYILPSSISKKVHFSPTVHADPRQIVQAKPRIHPAASPGAKPLSWHISSETKPTLKGTHQKSLYSSNTKETTLKSSEVFHLIDDEESLQARSFTAQEQILSRNPASGIAYYKDTTSSAGSRPMTPFRSFNHHPSTQNHISKAPPPRSKSLLSAFFVRQKTPKLK